MPDNPSILRKMLTELTQPVTYQLRLGDETITLNDLLGKPITLTFLGNIYCIQCGRKTKKSFQQGYCFPCMRRINECDNCHLHPERCHVEDGTCPKDDWAHAPCDQTHIVYLANSSGLKVGVTRETQVPTRWIDQGAIAALAIFKTQNRRQAGLVEVAFKQYVNDKTNWRVMLKGEIAEIDLQQQRLRLLDEARIDIDEIVARYEPGVIESLAHQEMASIHYPVLEYPTKITSLNLDKTPEISGVLKGIKGQYLILDNGVLNVRKFGGYECEFKGATQ